MTIEELKAKRLRFLLRSKMGYAEFIDEEICNLAIFLIDEKISQLKAAQELLDQKRKEGRKAKR